MIANCGVLGLDWREANLSDYLEALEAYNEQQNGGASLDAAQADKLRRFNAAHGVN